VSFPAASSTPPTLPSLDPLNKFDNIPKNKLKSTQYLQLVPDHRIYGTFKDALCGIKELFRGKLLQVDKKVKANGNHVWTYRCDHIRDNGCKK
jgi:hypothetical protein